MTSRKFMSCAGTVLSKRACDKVAKSNKNITTQLSESYTEGSKLMKHDLIHASKIISALGLYTTKKERTRSACDAPKQRSNQGGITPGDGAKVHILFTSIERCTLRGSTCSILVVSSVFAVVETRNATQSLQHKRCNNRFMQRLWDKLMSLVQNDRYPHVKNTVFRW